MWKYECRWRIWEFSEQLGEEKEPSEKEIIENLMDCLIDYEINGQNAKN